MDNKAMFKLSYGLFVLTAHENGFDNGCIINTAMQVTTTPNRISITVNKENKTHDMIQDTGKFNISMLAECVPFDVFKHFGFQSGKTVNKFAGYENTKRSENGIMYLPKYTTAFISATVYSCVDLGTHTMFIANVVDAQVLSDEKSITYDYYQSNTKPKPQKVETTAKTAYRCRICGYIHEGELPENFVCPICKHGASDFEKIK